MDKCDILRSFSSISWVHRLHCHTDLYVSV
jgi:hypothetical protein